MRPLPSIAVYSAGDLMVVNTVLPTAQSSACKTDIYQKKKKLISWQKITQEHSSFYGSEISDQE